MPTGVPTTNLKDFLLTPDTKWKTQNILRLKTIMR